MKRTTLVVYAFLAGCQSAPPPPPVPPPPPPRAQEACPRPPALPAPTAATAPPASTGVLPPAEVVRIVPGESVGPIRIGMTRREIEALGVLRQHPRWPGMTVPYHVGYDDEDRAVRLQVSLLAAPTDVRIDGTTIPRGTRFAEARAILPGCTKPDIGFGGGGYTCIGGLVDVSGGSGAPNELWVGTRAKK